MIIYKLIVFLPLLGAIIAGLGGNQIGAKASEYITTGLLLMSDDGVFIHRMSSPRHHVPKVYRVTCAEPVTPRQIETLLQGVVLRDDPKPVRAAACELRAPDAIDLTLTEGKYHQVKRMLAAVGNSVAQLHRWRIGEVELPAELRPGEWRWLGEAERAALGAR